MDNVMTKKTSKILVVSSNAEVTKRLCAALKGEDDLSVTASGSTLAEMNGQAQSKTSHQDVVVFEAHPEDEKEISALKALTHQQDCATNFIAVSATDLPMSTTRMLKQLGVEEVLPISISSAELADTVHHSLHIHAAETPVESQSGGKVVAVSKARGGVGATTVAVNLAYALLGRHGVFRKTASQRVVLLDLDIQLGNVAVFLDLVANNALIDLAREDELPDANLIRTSVLAHDSGLHVISAPAMLVPVTLFSASKISNLLAALRRDYDYVVIDLPGVLMDWVDPVLTACDRLLMTTDLTVPSVRNARRLIDFFHSDHLDLNVDIVVNHEAKPLFLGKNHRDTAHALNCPLGHWLPHDAKRIGQSVDDGVPIIAASPGAAFSRSIAKTAASIVQNAEIKTIATT